LNQQADAERWFAELDKAGAAGDDDFRVRADQLLDLRRFADAAVLYESLAGKTGQRTAATAAQLWYSAAYSRWLGGDNDAASRDAVRAIAIAGAESIRAVAQSHALVANIMMIKGDNELASEAARRAVAADPAYPWAHVQLARALNLLGRAAEAEAPAREAVELNGKSSEGHFVLASALFLQKKWDLALASYEQAARLDTTNAYAAYNAGLSLENLGRPRDALAWYEETLRRAPQMKERDEVLASIARVRGKG
jgi:tetratricopeptide (TPR) repeat protein